MGGNTGLSRVFVFETEPMTLAPSHMTMKNFHPRYRPLSQPLPLPSLYREPPESNLLYAPCFVFLCFLFVFFCKGVFPIFCFSFLPVRYRKSMCVVSCSTETVAQWPIHAAHMVQLQRFNHAISFYTLDTRAFVNKVSGSGGRGLVGGWQSVVCPHDVHRSGCQGSTIII